MFYCRGRLHLPYQQLLSLFKASIYSHSHSSIPFATVSAVSSQSQHKKSPFRSMSLQEKPAESSQTKESKIANEFILFRNNYKPHSIPLRRCSRCWRIKERNTNV